MSGRHCGRTGFAIAELPACHAELPNIAARMNQARRTRGDKVKFVRPFIPFIQRTVRESITAADYNVGLYLGPSNEANKQTPEPSHEPAR